MYLVSGDDITVAANYLLLVLSQETSLPYSRFYDGTDASSDRLADELGLSQHNPSPTVVLVLAAAALHQRGLVRCQDLPHRASTIEPDFKMSITADGRSFVARREHVELPSVHL